MGKKCLPSVYTVTHTYTLKPASRTHPREITILVSQCKRKDILESKNGPTIFFHDSVIIATIRNVGKKCLPSVCTVTHTYTLTPTSRTHPLEITILVSQCKREDILESKNGPPIFFHDSVIVRNVGKKCLPSVYAVTHTHTLTPISRTHPREITILVSQCKRKDILESKKWAFNIFS